MQRSRCPDMMLTTGIKAQKSLLFSFLKRNTQVRDELELDSAGVEPSVPPFLKAFATHLITASPSERHLEQRQAMCLCGTQISPPEQLLRMQTHGLRSDQNAVIDWALRQTGARLPSVACDE